MAKTTRVGVTSWFVCLSVLTILAGCSSRTLSTSAQDQTLVPGQETSAQSAPAGSKTLKEVHVTESATIPAPPPLVASKPTVKPVPGGQPAPPASDLDSMTDIFFDYDRFALRTDAKATLEANARVLKTKNGMKLLIEGHCDERGTLAYNLVLGERRAQSVKRYLEELEIPVSQIHITSYGKERPFCTEHREACWQQNRLAHFVTQ